jgi:hypothetical protein
LQCQGSAALIVIKEFRAWFDVRAILSVFVQPDQGGNLDRFAVPSWSRDLAF